MRAVLVRLVGCAVVAGVVSTAAIAPARAGLGLVGWTPQVGISSGPDQFVVGAHLDLGELVPTLRLGVHGDVGFGDNITLVTVGPSALFQFPIQENNAFYAGGTLALTYANLNGPDGPGGKGDDTRSDVGLAAVLGYMHAMGGGHLVADLKVELSDYADVKVTGGYRMNLTE